MAQRDWHWPHAPKLGALRGHFASGYPPHHQQFAGKSGVCPIDGCQWVAPGCRPDCIRKTGSHKHPGFYGLWSLQALERQDDLHLATLDCSADGLTGVPRRLGGAA